MNWQRPLMLGVGLGMVLWADPAAASPATLIDRTFLIRHNSRMTGQMVLKVEEWYGIPAHVFLAVTGAETSMGDPKLGGTLVKVNNFGCIKAYKGWQQTKWGAMANGTIEVAGKTWLMFPDPWAGVVGMGRLLKVGPSGDPGFYRACLTAKPVPQWERFAAVWYGKNVPGYWEYLTNLRVIHERVLVQGRKAGLAW